MSLEQIYSEICDGYSELEGCQFRHLSFIDQSRLQRRYDEALAWSTSNGGKTESQILRERQQDGSWSSAKALHIKSLQEKIDGIERAKSKIKSLAQIDDQYETLQRMRKELRQYLDEKYTFLGNCAELYADGRMRFYTLIQCIFKDGSPLFNSEEDLDSLSDIKYSILERQYFEKTSSLSIENIKKICIEPFFCIPFGLTEKPIDFFGIPAAKLSIYQVNLLRLGQTYAKIANETPDLPKDYEKCPERMLMYWYFLQNGGKKLEEERDNTAQRFMGLAKSLPKR